MTDIILAEVSCSLSFNMQSVLVSRESLWRLCGYGLSSTDWYLDDQVKHMTSLRKPIMNS